MNNITIGKFAKICAVGIETIRFYQRQGILNIPQYEKDSKVRYYNDNDISSLQFILSAKKAGFTLKEIKELLELDAINDRKAVRNISQKRIVLLNTKITELNEARDFLYRLVKECKKNNSKTCPILIAFKESAKDT